MNKFFLPLCAVVAMALCSCSTSGLKVNFTSDNSTLETQTRNISGFERVDVIGSPTVYYLQSDSFSVRVKGPNAEYINNILTEVDNGTLRIRNKNKIGFGNISSRGDKGVTVYVSSPDLIGVTLNGSGDFISERRVDTDVLNISLKGSGDVRFTDVVCDRCDAELVGSGDLDIEHLDTRETSATLIGSGDLDIRQINSARTQLQLRGSGDIDIEFISGCGAVDAELLGSGDITLKGQVRSLDMRKRGSGDINSNDLKVGQ